MGQQRVLNQIKRGGGFGPDDQIDLFFGHRQRQVLVFGDGFQLKARVPFSGLIDIALYHGQPRLGCGLGPLIGAVNGQEAIQGNGGDQCTGHGAGSQDQRRGDRLELPRLFDPAEDGQGQGHIHQNDQPREPVDAEQIRDLNHPQVLMLTVSEQLPWKTGKEPGAQKFDGDPGKRRHHQGLQRAAAFADQPSEQAGETAQYHGEKHQYANGLNPGDIAIFVHGMDRPVHHGQVGDRSCAESEREAEAARGFAQRQQHRYEADPGQPALGNFRKRRSQHQSAEQCQYPLGACGVE